jgi:hypothetical protein
MGQVRNIYGACLYLDIVVLVSSTGLPYFTGVQKITFGTHMPYAPRPGISAHYGTFRPFDQNNWFS